MYDAIVAGGGPAGSSTAAFLRQRGRRVLLLEREQFPRFHLGESLLPFASDLFKELGVFEEIDGRYLHKPGARVVHEESGTAFTYYFDTAIRGGRPYAYQVPRADFDHLLLKNAERLGAEVREQTEVRDVVFHPDRVTVQAREAPSCGRERTYTEEAAMFVDATGRDTLLATAQGLKVADELVSTNVAAFSHWEGCPRETGPDEGNFTLLMFDGGWWWVIPFKGTVTSIGVVFEKSYTLARKGMSPAELYEGAIAGQREIRKIIGDGRRVRPIETTGNWSYRSRRFYGDRFVLVGDAAAFIDPLFSTGVLMALQSARYAAQVIDEGLREGDLGAARLARYEEQALGGADLFRHLVREFYGEGLRELLLASSTNPTVCSIIASILAGDVYEKALWQTLVRPGFSRQAAAQGRGPRVANSRQTRATKSDR